MSKKTAKPEIQKVVATEEAFRAVVAADQTKKIPKKPRGRPFSSGTSGNPAGRRHGSLNKTTLALRERLRGETEVLIEKAIELAQNGNVPMLKYCLSQATAPSGIEIPKLTSPIACTQALCAVTEAAASGDISQTDATAIVTMIKGCREAMNRHGIDSLFEGTVAHVEFNRLVDKYPPNGSTEEIRLRSAGFHKELCALNLPRKLHDEYLSKYDAMIAPEMRRELAIEDTVAAFEELMAKFPPDVEEGSRLKRNWAAFHQQLDKLELTESLHQRLAKQYDDRVGDENIEAFLNEEADLAFARLVKQYPARRRPPHNKHNWTCFHAKLDELDLSPSQRQRFAARYDELHGEEAVDQFRKEIAEDFEADSRFVDLTRQFTGGELWPENVERWAHFCKKLRLLNLSAHQFERLRLKHFPEIASEAFDDYREVPEPDDYPDAAQLIDDDGQH